MISYEKTSYATCTLLKFIQNMFVGGATFSMKAFKTMFFKRDSQMLLPLLKDFPETIPNMFCKESPKVE